MALTLSEAEKFTTNMVIKGVLKEIIKDSFVLEKLPFKDVVGNAIQYLRENTLGNATFYSPGEVWQEATPAFTQKTAGIKIMGGDADIDEFLKRTRSDKTDLEAETITAKAKGIKHTFLDRFFYGDSAVNTKEFDGLHALMSGVTAQMIHQGSSATGAACSVINLDTLVDLILDGPPDALLMHKALRRRLNAYVRAGVNSGTAGTISNETRDQFGSKMSRYGDVPIAVDDFLTLTETIASDAYSAKTGGATMSVFAVRFGEQDVCGLQNGALETKKLGQLENKDAERWRIKWYVGLVNYRTISLARMDGITDAAVVA